jgi:hypothetical protein
MEIKYVKPTESESTPFKNIKAGQIVYRSGTVLAIKTTNSALVDLCDGKIFLNVRGTEHFQIATAHVVAEYVELAEDES